MNRGVLYLRWRGDYRPFAGAPSVDEAMQQSIASVRQWHPELPCHIADLPDDSTLLVKSRMMQLSPFDETLFLDADTKVMGKLDFGFLKARQHGLACCINANPWQRRYYKLQREHDDAIEYSSGVIFWDRTWEPGARSDSTLYASVRDVFILWDMLSSDPAIDSRSRYMGKHGEREQAHNDQALFTLAMEQLRFNPCVLPLNWNLYPTWQKQFWAEVKIWHGYFDVPQGVIDWNTEQRDPNAVVQCGGLD